MSMGYGARLKIFAKTHFGTQAAFAAVIGMGSVQLSDYVREQHFPGQVLLEGFARVGGNVNWLLTGEGPMMVTERQLNGMAVPMTPIDELRSVIARATVLVGDVEREMRGQSGAL